MVEEEKYCARCGRKCTKGAANKNGKIYGPFCVTQIPNDNSEKGNLDEVF